MTGAPINLNKARKARARQKARQTAEENAVRFGRNKAAKLRDQAETDRQLRSVDGHRLDPDE